MQKKIIFIPRFLSHQICLRITLSRFTIATALLLSVSNSFAMDNIPLPPDMPGKPVVEPVADRHYYHALNNTQTTKIDFDYSDIKTSDNSLSDAGVLLASSFEDTDSQSEATPKKPEKTEEAASGGYTQAEINEMINNPLGKLWMLMIQNDFTSYGGDGFDDNDIDNITQNTMLIQPVMPFQLTDNIKLIFRPVIPIVSYETVNSVDIGYDGTKPVIENVDFNRENGLGDIVLWTAFATNEMAKPPNIFGVGTTVMLDTASEDELGTGQNSAGPMALAFHIDDDWIYGTIVQHWWSFNEDSDRNRVNLTDIQYVGRYRYTQDTTIGFSPNIRYNWEADGTNRWTIPIGIGGDTMIKMGPLPVKVGLELQYYVKQPDKFGPEWNLRLYFIPVIPAPSWTQKALF